MINRKTQVKADMQAIVVYLNSFTNLDEETVLPERLSLAYEHDQERDSKLSRRLKIISQELLIKNAAEDLIYWVNVQYLIHHKKGCVKVLKSPIIKQLAHN